MQLAILHHHLNRGGVTQVIQNHLRCLAALDQCERPERVVVFFDGQRDGWREEAQAGIPVRLVVEPLLAYDSPGSESISPERLADAIEGRLSEESFQCAQALLHIHNHSLGKSAALPGALALLAERGWRQLLQTHDFAEDNRPANYRHLVEMLGCGGQELGRLLYPQASHIHYATLTERDSRVLRMAGVAAERLRTLPNPVEGFGSLPAAEEARSRVLPALGLRRDASLTVYPVRGIRRKNLGEMLLLAALAPAGHAFAVTLAPKNPVERESFDRWRDLAERLGLACRFDTGGEFGLSFHDTLASADEFLTTSVAEGFGMVFLEAWLAGRGLVGRDLPEVTREFRGSGVVFDKLWESLPVPLGLLDESQVRRSLEATHREACEAYGVSPLPQDCLRDQIEEMIVGGLVDFGRLGVDRQAGLIERVASDPAARRSLLEAAPKRTGQVGPGLIEKNATAVQRAYSAKTIGQLLAAAYSAVMASEPGPVSPAEGGERVLRHYLAPERLHAVRMSS